MKYTDTYIKSDAFLDTFEWRKVRMEAIIKYGKRCQCCGAVPHYTNDVQINVDHIKSRKTNPELALVLDNLQVLCHICNHGKGNWDSTDWRDGQATPHNSEVSTKIKTPVKSILLSKDIKIPKFVHNRTRKFPSSVSRLVCGVIITNLLVGIKTGSVVAYQRNKNAPIVSSRKVSTREIIRCVDFLESEGYLINRIGKGSRTKKYRIMSSIEHTEKFIDSFSTPIGVECLEEIVSDWQESYYSQLVVT